MVSQQRAFSVSTSAVGMPTPRSLGFDMKYTRAGDGVDGTKRPLVVVAGWMGAKEKQLQQPRTYARIHD